MDAPEIIVCQNEVSKALAHCMDYRKYNDTYRRYMTKFMYLADTGVILGCLKVYKDLLSSALETTGNTEFYDDRVKYIGDVIYHYESLNDVVGNSGDVIIPGGISLDPEDIA